MIQLIVGEKGKGKTKHLLDKVNGAANTVSGNIVYLDKNSKHMYEIKNSIRLINASEYPISNTGEFIGLPDGQMGNSEVGHLNIGAGRVVYQDLVKMI